jgi:hypothetical protein
MKRKIEDGTHPFAVRLPQKLQERLRRAGGEGGMGEEIRKRLEKSFETEKTPKKPKTRNLLMATGFIAEKAGMYFGDWSEDPFAFEILKAGVNLWLTANRPKGEPVMKPNPNREPFDSFFDPSSTPENIASSILANLTWLREERAGGASDEIIPRLIASVEAAPGYSPAEGDVTRARARRADERKRR